LSLTPPLTRGDLVLIQFPFTDLSAQKLRPALIVGRVSGDDVIIAFISSRMFSTDPSAEHALGSTDAEFGTTGLHQPFKVLTTKPSIFGQPTFTYLDAGESSTRSYAAFLVKAPRDFRGVDRVVYGGGQLVIHELGGERELTVQADRLFW